MILDVPTSDELTQAGTKTSQPWLGYGPTLPADQLVNENSVSPGWQAAVYAPRSWVMLSPNITNIPSRELFVVVLKLRTVQEGEAGFISLIVARSSRCSGPSPRPIGVAGLRQKQP
jgi:hypothetical protein